MSDKETRWYDLGFALEKARQAPSRDRLDSLVDRLMSFRNGTDGRAKGDSGRSSERRGSRGASDGADAFDRVLGGGVAVLTQQLVRAVPTHSDPSVMRVAKGAAAGAAATLLRELTHPLLSGRLEFPSIADGFPERLASGAARGALFAAVLDPRIPGPAPLRGAVFASVEYLLAPGGGLSPYVGKIAPWRIIPGADSVVKKLERGEESIIDHLVFGLALALLLGEA
jgi:hypothetical protein